VHAGRKAFTNTKSIAIDFLGVSPKTAGALDAVFMLAYAIGLVSLGSLGDSRNPIKLLVFALLGMAVLQIAFAECIVRGYISTTVGIVWIFGVWILNGLVQSLAWPCCIKLVQTYLNDHPKGTTIFSFWACNGIVGNIVSSLIADLIMDGDAGIERLSDFRSVFIITSLLNITVSVFVFRLPDWAGRGSVAHQGIELENSHSLMMSSRNAGVENDEGRKTEQIQDACVEDGSTPTTVVEEGGLMVRTQNMSFKETLGIRGVLDYSFCHLCIKGVAYAMFFWLPFYLIKAHGVEPGTAAVLSIVYDVATLVGGPTCGYLVEVSKKPATIIGVSVLLAAGPQFLINGGSNASFTRLLMESPNSAIPFGVIVNIVLSGFLVGGVLNVLSAAICASFGGHSAAKVTGIIDGFGSLGASATQIIIPLVGVGNGWGTVFGMLGALLVLSAFTLFRIVRDEWRMGGFA
jgi:OPA family glycerol-3-phosphate transporter-like MFS transporter 3